MFTTAARRFHSSMWLSTTKFPGPRSGSGFAVGFDKMTVPSGTSAPAHLARVTRPYRFVIAAS